MKSNVSQTFRRYGDARRALAAAVLGAAVCVACPLWARAELPSIAEVERAVLEADAGAGSLQESWAPVVRLLTAVNHQTRDPVLRLIKGHACLAVNENNESVSLFLSVQEPEQKEEWLRWAERFAARHSNEPIAHYLYGDALARLGRWGGAVARFTMAIERAPNQRHALALNGRGVAYAGRAAWRAASGDRDGAQDDYRMARANFADAFASAGDRLADAQANIGALALQRKDGPQGALRAFDKALSPKLSPHFALAFHGRACVKVIQSDPEGAKNDFQAALAHAPCDQTRALMRANQLRMHSHSGCMNSQELLAALGADDETGATIGGAFGSVIGGAIGGVFGGLPGASLGGVDLAVPSDIEWDEGLWPFAGYFTLAYRNHCADMPVAERRP